jgi:putative hydrolase of the HAD superfamily
MTIRAVVFDLDDTLVDHSGAARAGFASWLATLGTTPLPTAECEALWFALEARDYERYLAGELSFTGQRRSRLREFRLQLGLADLDDHELDVVYTGYLAAYTRAWRAHDDAVPTLHRVRDAGLATAVLTNGDQDQQEAKLRATGLLPLSGPVFASSSLGAAKPSPDAYDKVAAALGLSPTELLMVGDHPVNDVSGAREAGWSALHLDRSGLSTGAIATLGDVSW